MADEKRTILDFLEQQLLGPVLRLNPDDLAPFRRADAEDARSRVGLERERLHNAPSAAAVVLAFREAADRSAADGLDARLRELELPTLAAVRDEVEKLAAELGMTSSIERAEFPT